MIPIDRLVALDRERGRWAGEGRLDLGVYGGPVLLEYQAVVAAAVENGVVNGRLGALASTLTKAPVALAVALLPPLSGAFDGCGAARGVPICGGVLQPPPSAFGDRVSHPRTEDGTHSGRVGRLPVSVKPELSRAARLGNGTASQPIPIMASPRRSPSASPGSSEGRLRCHLRS
jgi:hypothetical protein